PDDGIGAERGKCWKDGREEPYYRRDDGRAPPDRAVLLVREHVDREGDGEEGDRRDDLLAPTGEVAIEQTASAGFAGPILLQRRCSRGHRGIDLFRLAIAAYSLQCVGVRSTMKYARWRPRYGGRSGIGRRVGAVAVIESHRDRRRRGHGGVDDRRVVGAEDDPSVPNHRESST